MPPAGFEPTISVGERPQTYALDRAATGTSDLYRYGGQILEEIFYKSLERHAEEKQQCGRTLKFSDPAAVTALHKKAFRDVALKIAPYVKFTHRMSDCGSVVTKKKKKKLEPKANKGWMNCIKFLSSPPPKVSIYCKLNSVV